MAEKARGKYKDISEESSSRSDDASTKLARQMESDDQNEFTGSGMVPGPKGDSAAENKVATSLDDE